MRDFIQNSPEVVIAFITALFGTIGSIGVASLRSRNDTEELKGVTNKALESAQTAASNTTNISNGFVGRMDRKLDHITEQQDLFHAKFTEHLEWHLRQENT